MRYYQLVYYCDLFSGQRGIVVACVCLYSRKLTRPDFDHVVGLFILKDVHLSVRSIVPQSVCELCIMGYSQLVLKMEDIDLDQLNFKVILT